MRDRVSPESGAEVEGGDSALSMDLRNSVIIADDHTMFRQGIKTLLESEEFDVVAQADNGHEAIRMARKHSPQVAILDYSMPLLNGIDTAKEIQKQSPQTAVVLLTMYDDGIYALEALRAGVRGYVLKHQATADLVDAIRKVLLGLVYLSPVISEVVVKALISNEEPRSDPLTCRERQVMQLIAEGNTTKDIALLLHLSVKTVESHRCRIMSKLDIHNIANLVRYSIRAGMIQA